jgi:hypothetical protein
MIPGIIAAFKRYAKGFAPMSRPPRPAPENA